MDYLLAFLVAALSAALAYAILNKELADKLKFFNIVSAKRKHEARALSSVQIWVCVLTIFTVSVLTVIRIVQNVSNPLGVTKMIISLICVIGAACFDFRERRIPNIFPLVLALSGIFLLAMGVILQQNGAVAYIASSVVATVLCAVFLILASMLTKEGIGAGDIKLICALALIGGIHTVIGTLFYAAVLCSLAAIISLILKIKTLSGSLPFGPFILLGFYISVLTLNF